MGATVATCKDCGQAIRWEQRGGKSHKLDADGGNHWTNCRGGKKKKYAGPLTIRGRRVTGPQYRESCELCDVQPWESCSCSALMSEDQRTCVHVKESEPHVKVNRMEAEHV